MTHRFYISQFRTAFLAAGAVAMFAVAGCAKQEAGANGQDCPMSIQPEVVSADGALKSNDGGATKATLINEAAGLQAQGFGLSIYNDEMAYKDKVTMVYDGGWKPSDGTMDWRWPLKTVYTFYAWSPATLVTDVAASGIQPFTYSGIADQKDIMIGYYSGIGNNGAAPVKFSHALSSVQFKTGTMTGLGNITGIELSGVATSGTCTPTASGSETVNFAWGSFSDNTTLTQSGLTAASTTSGTAIGTPFLVMPQSAALTVKLTDSGSKTVTATISAPALTAGKTAVYTINYDGQTVSLTVSIEDWINGQSGTVEIEAGAIVIDVQNDYETFKTNVESSSFDGYKNKTIIFKNIGDWEESYSISDTYGNLEGATLDFKGATLSPTNEFGPSSPYISNNYGYLFKDLTSPDITIKNLTFKSKFFSLPYDCHFSSLIGTYSNATGSISFGNCSVTLIGANGFCPMAPTFGAFVGYLHCKNATFSDCDVVMPGSTIINVPYAGGFIGRVYNTDNIRFKNCSVSGGTIGKATVETLIEWVTDHGIYIGVLEPSEGTSIVFEDSSASYIAIYGMCDNTVSNYYSKDGEIPLHCLPSKESGYTVTFNNYSENPVVYNKTIEVSIAPEVDPDDPGGKVEVDPDDGGKVADDPIK